MLFKFRKKGHSTKWIPTIQWQQKRLLSHSAAAFSDFANLQWNSNRLQCIYCERLRSEAVTHECVCVCVSERGWINEVTNRTGDLQNTVTEACQCPIYFQLPPLLQQKNSTKVHLCINMFWSSFYCVGWGIEATGFIWQLEKPRVFLIYSKGIRCICRSSSTCLSLAGIFDRQVDGEPAGWHRGSW